MQDTTEPNLNYSKRDPFELDRIQVQNSGRATFPDAHSTLFVTRSRPWQTHKEDLQ